MTNLGSSAPRSTFWRGKKPNLADLGALLNHLTEAALILDRAERRVMFVNPEFLTLTAFSADELTQRYLIELIPDTMNQPIELEEECQVRLVRKNRPPLEVKIKVSPLDETGNWLIGTFIPARRELVKNWYSLLLEGFIQLSQLGNKSSFLDTLEGAVRILRTILGLELVGIYQVDSAQPRLRLQTAYDPILILPDTLPLSDLIHLSTPMIWYPGRRITTELYRNGRIKGASYLATVPLGEDGAWLGLMVVGDRSAQPIDDLLKYITLVAGILSSAFLHQILVTNQQNMIVDQQQSLELQNVLIENVHEGIILLAPDLTIVEMNPIAEGMLGYTEAEIKHQPVDNVVIGCERLIPALNTALRGVPTHNLGHASLHRRDGQAFPVNIKTIPVEKDGKVQTILILVTDISADEQTRIRTQQLEQRAVVGEVINAFAHEVRNPINNISLGVTVLAGELAAEDPKQEAITRIQNDCARLTHLMESILSSSRPMEAHFEVVNPQILLRKIMERWRPRLAKVNVQQYSEFDPNTPLIKGDARALDQVFTNLISNAVDVMHKQGGGTLSIKSAPLNVIPNLPQVEISVTDDGPGIPDDIRDHIFEPFVSNKPRGTGLGLAITKQIVTAHRGSIKVNTFPGGTVFSVILPANLDGEN